MFCAREKKAKTYFEWDADQYFMWSLLMHKCKYDFFKICIPKLEKILLKVLEESKLHENLM